MVGPNSFSSLDGFNWTCKLAISEWIVNWLFISTVCTIIIWCNTIAMGLLFGNHNIVDKLKLEFPFTWFPYIDFWGRWMLFPEPPVCVLGVWLYGSLHLIVYRKLPQILVLFRPSSWMVTLSAKINYFLIGSFAFGFCLDQ